MNQREIQEELYMSVSHGEVLHSTSPRYHDHIAARWDVWARGWALLCDVNGILYVYGVDR